MCARIEVGYKEMGKKLCKFHMVHLESSFYYFLFIYFGGILKKYRDIVIVQLLFLLTFFFLATDSLCVFAALTHKFLHLCSLIVYQCVYFEADHFFRLRCEKCK